MQTFYNKDFRMNEDGLALDTEVMKAVEPIFKKYMALGYSPREIAHISAWAVGSVELTEIL